jgi:hypothetical protein
LPGDDPRVIGTIEAIQRELVTNGFVHRDRTGPVPNLDGLPGEGASLACSLWRVDALDIPNPPSIEAWILGICRNSSPISTCHTDLDAASAHDCHFQVQLLQVDFPVWAISKILRSSACCPGGSMIPRAAG